jgi:hypothetical protein
MVEDLGVENDPVCDFDSGLGRQNQFAVDDRGEYAVSEIQFLRDSHRCARLHTPTLFTDCTKVARDCTSWRIAKLHAPAHNLPE